jgi:hypothetical protein
MHALDEISRQLLYLLRGLPATVAVELCTSLIIINCNQPFSPGRKSLHQLAETGAKHTLRKRRLGSNACDVRSSCSRRKLSIHQIG